MQRRIFVLLNLVLILSLFITPVALAAPADPPAHLKEVPLPAAKPGREAPASVAPVPFKGAADYYVRLEQPPVLASDAYGTGLQGSYLQSLEVAQAAVQPRLEQAGAQVLSSYQYVYNGFLARMTPAEAAKVAEIPGVVRVARAPIFELDLGYSVPLVGADMVWEELDYQGEGVNIAVIDTGIDYTHAVFGGPGKAAYEADNHDVITDTLSPFPTAKVIGGWDFAGKLYDAGCSAAEETNGDCTTTPEPDPDPIDVHGHGTHVASTAAGMMAGEVYSGVAPMANLFALKVFGDKTGSTNLSMDAYEWIANHNETYSQTMSMQVHVVNLSIGSNFGPTYGGYELEMATENLSDSGVVIVSSAGNAGQLARYIVGSPASADSVIAVAASTTGYATGPTVRTVDYMTLTAAIYQPPSFDNGTGLLTETLEAELVYAGTLTNTDTLCDVSGIAADALDGDIALIQRGGCAFSAKVNNAAALGAAAALIFNHATGGDAFITMIGDPVQIPAGAIMHSNGLAFAALSGETVRMSAYNELGQAPSPIPADSIASFSSQGPRNYDSMLKPEVTAPGVGIFAAKVGSGDEGVSMSGTSMASPHAAGVAALVRQARPGWTVEQIKAAMMNTADNLADGTPIPTSGAGRVDAYAATTTKVVAVGDEELVSVSFGVVYDGDSDEDGMKMVEQPVTLYSWYTDTHTYTVQTMFQTGSITEGVTMHVDPMTVTLPAGGEATVTVTLELETAKMPFIYGVLEDIYGFVRFMDMDTMYDCFRLPFYAAPRPYTDLDISGDGVINDPTMDTAMYEITATGAISAELWAMPALIHDPLDVGATDGITQHLDLRLIGMKAAATAYGPTAIVGINTYGAWSSPQPAIAGFEVFVDVDEDGTDDYRLYAYNLEQWLYGGSYDPDDNWIVLLDDLSTTADDDPYYADLASPYFIYTDYNASYTEWIIPGVTLGLSMSNPDFDFHVVSKDWWHVETAEDIIDETDMADFSIYDNIFTYEFGDMAPGPDAQMTTLEVGINSARVYNEVEPLGVMLIDYHGDPRGSAKDRYPVYLLPITVVEDMATLKVFKAADPMMGAMPGDEITYTITISNSASVTATGVVFTDVLPLQAVFVDWFHTPMTYTMDTVLDVEADKKITWVDGVVPPDTELEFVFGVELLTQDRVSYADVRANNDTLLNTVMMDYIGMDGATAYAVLDIPYYIYLPIVSKGYMP